MTTKIEKDPGLNRPGVRALVNYLGEAEETPFGHETDTAKDQLERDPQMVEICDARAIMDQLSLDLQGFRLLRHRPTVQDFRDPIQRDAYLHEMQEVVQRETGADLVISPVQPVVRFNDPTKPNIHKPGALVHSDFTELTLRRQLAHKVDLSAPEFRQYKRIEAYQTWRALSPPPQDMPLALVDGRTVNVDYRVKSNFSISFPKPDVLEFYLYHYDPANRWYYFPDMQIDEVLMWKAYNGDEPNDLYVVHSAFAAPDCPKNTPPRESIETRTFAFFRD